MSTLTTSLNLKRKYVAFNSESNATPSRKYLSLSISLKSFSILSKEPNNNIGIALDSYLRRKYNGASSDVDNITSATY